MLRAWLQQSLDGELPCIQSSQLDGELPCIESSQLAGLGRTTMYRILATTAFGWRTTMYRVIAVGRTCSDRSWMANCHVSSQLCLDYRSIAWRRQPWIPNF